jgi:hypothetical protein
MNECEDCGKQAEEANELCKPRKVSHMESDCDLIRELCKPRKVSHEDANKEKDKNEKASMPNIVINITYNDNRVGKDESTYVDNVTMLDSEEE